MVFTTVRLWVGVKEKESVGEEERVIVCDELNEIDCVRDAELVGMQENRRT